MSRIRLDKSRDDLKSICMDRLWVAATLAKVQAPAKHIITLNYPNLNLISSKQHSTWIIPKRNVAHLYT